MSQQDSEEVLLLRKRVEDLESAFTKLRNTVALLLASARVQLDKDLLKVEEIIEYVPTALHAWDGVIGISLSSEKEEKPEEVESAEDRYIREGLVPWSGIPKKNH